MQSESTANLNWSTLLGYLRKGGPAPVHKITKTESEWRQQLNAEQYRITRQHGTERPGTGAYCHLFEPGVYGCVCCNEKLFDAGHKFESGTGWPSFTHPVHPGALQYKSDNSFGMLRIEVLCNVCDAHLGHVFPDGPPPAGLRFCINSASLIKLSPHE